MGEPIVVNKDLPTDDADVLAGSVLDPVPGPGTLYIWVASSQRDGEVTVTGPGISAIYKKPPVLRANGIPDLNSDMPYVVQTLGGKVLIDYNEVTGGDAFATVMFVPR